MLDLESFAREAALWFSIAAGLAFLLRLAISKKPVPLISEALAFLYFAAITVSLAVRTMKSGHAPMANRYESLASFAWSIGFVYWYVRIRYKEFRTGYFLMPLATLVMFMVSISPSGIIPLYPALDTWMFTT
ncbi:MAG: hypothetical protein ACYDFU_10595, partial [Nitrospirota bacterium]